MLSIIDRTEVGDRFAITFEGPPPELPHLPFVTGLRGIVRELLLYVPLGLLLALATVGGRRRFVGPWMLAGLVAGVAIGAGGGFVGRNLSAVKLVADGAGYVVGYGLVVAVARMARLDLRARLGIAAGGEGDAKTEAIAVARCFYFGAYLFVALLQFDVMLSLDKIYAQLLPDELGRVWIILDPRYHLSRWDTTGVRLMIELLALIPIGMLTAWLAGLKGRLSLIGAVFSTVVVAAFCEFCQLFIAARTTDIVLLLVAVLAGGVGWGAAKLWLGLQNIQANAEPSRGENAWRAAAVLLIGYLCVISFFAWFPFRFEDNPGAVIDKNIYRSNLWPFKDHVIAHDLGSVIDVVKEFGLFVPLGGLVAFLLHGLTPNLHRSHNFVMTAMVCLVFAVVTELAQSITLGRFMDVTDVLLASAGGLAGAIVLDFLRSVRVITAHTGPPKDRRRRRRKRVRRYW